MCYNCGEEGHAAVNCTAAKRRKPCFVCGSLEHNVKQCTKVCLKINKYLSLAFILIITYLLVAFNLTEFICRFEFLVFWYLLFFPLGWMGREVFG